MAKTVISIPELLKKSPTTPAKDRNVKGFPLTGIWMPFLKAAQINGEANFSHDALGAPLVDKYNKDGTPKLNDKGERVKAVEPKEIMPAIKGVMDNIGFGFATYAVQTQKAHPLEWKALEEACKVAGDRIHAREDATFGSYMEALEQARAAIAAAAKTPATETETEKELVAA